MLEASLAKCYDRHMNLRGRNKQTQGFTIVELLIVIVVIAVLAAIVIVAYQGVQNRANDTAVQNDLRTIGSKIAEYRVVNNDVSPANGTEYVASGAKASHNAYGAHYVPAGSSGYNLLHCYTSSSSDTWGLVAASKSGAVYIFKNGSVTTGVGPLTTYTTTCANNGLPAGGQWLFVNGVWQI